MFKLQRLEISGFKSFADPTEIVGAALYLASDASGFATGTTVTVDGGISA